MASLDGTLTLDCCTKLHGRTPFISAAGQSLPLTRSRKLLDSNPSALPEIVWVISSPSGRGIPLRAGSPRCCNDRRPGSGSPHPPRRGGSPIRPCLLHPLRLEEQRVPPEAWTVGPRWGGRYTHQRGSPARSRHPRPDGFDRASWLRPRLERLGAGVVAIAGLMTGAARLIPYCARPASTFLGARCASTGD